MHTLNPVWIRENTKQIQTCARSSYLLVMSAVQSFYTGKRKVQINQITMTFTHMMSGTDMYIFNYYVCNI